MVHSFRNALICASTVLECICYRIHRYVAAPSIHKNTAGARGGACRPNPGLFFHGHGWGEGGEGGTVQFSPTNGLCMIGGARTCSAPS